MISFSLFFSKYYFKLSWIYVFPKHKNERAAIDTPTYTTITSNQSPTARQRKSKITPEAKYFVGAKDQSLKSKDTLLLLSSSKR